MNFIIQQWRKFWHFVHLICIIIGFIITLGLFSVGITTLSVSRYEYGLVSKTIMSSTGYDELSGVDIGILLGSSGMGLSLISFLGLIYLLYRYNKHGARTNELEVIEREEKIKELTTELNKREANHMLQLRATQAFRRYGVAGMLTSLIFRTESNYTKFLDSCKHVDKILGAGEYPEQDNLPPPSDEANLKDLSLSLDEKMKLLNGDIYADQSVEPAKKAQPMRLMEHLKRDEEIRNRELNKKIY